MRGKRKTFGNIAGHIRGMDNVTVLSKWTAEQFDPTLNWKDVEWIKSLWPGKLILKGILDLEDARIAAKTGAAALVVSNHGGRQLDGAPSSISVLPPIVDAVGSSIEIIFDGGIRSGQDLMRALALGARACLSGRAYIYGLGAGGQAGVARAIEIMRNELDVSMALTGVNSIDELDRSVIVRRSVFILPRAAGKGDHAKHGGRGVGRRRWHSVFADTPPPPCDVPLATAQVRVLPPCPALRAGADKREPVPRRDPCARVVPATTPARKIAAS